jgi:hypothetical protein
MNIKNGLKNTNFVSLDGRFELVFNKNGELLTDKNDPVNMGTYNFAGANGTHKYQHTTSDVNPYKYLGNAEGGLGNTSKGQIRLFSESIGKVLINPKALWYQIKTGIKTPNYNTSDFLEVYNVKIKISLFGEI